MANDFDDILDECINRINRGVSLEACLADYPQYAERLEPLLRCVLNVQKPYAFVPSPDAKRTARQKFYAVLDKRREKPSIFARLAYKPVIFATATVIVLTIIGFFGVRPMLYSPPEQMVSPPPVTVPSPSPEPVPSPPPAPSPSPSPAPVPSPSPSPAPVPGPSPVPVPSVTGNFVFLISDEVNAIGDFDSLLVTISEVGLRVDGEPESWVEFVPELKTVDLTQLQGDKTQEIWRGDMPIGQYSQLFIYVSEVKGKLKATGQTIEIKLPSQKLHISKPFQISADAVTSFTYDLTVVATGADGKYILKPQIDQSGAQQKPNEDKAKSKK